MSAEKSKIESLEQVEVEWPCLTCGADRAPQCVYGEDLKVVGCTNCGHIEAGTHIESSLCWCYPILAFVSEETGNERWVHNLKH